MKPTLRHGDKDTDYPETDPKNIVSHLQTLLNTWAEDFSSGTAELLNVDGGLGNITLCRLLEFQTHSLVPHEDSSTIDGITGANTWEKLVAATSGLEISLEGTVAGPQLPWATQLPSRSHGDSNLGFEALKIAIDEIEAGAQEIGKNNKGEFVDKYLAPADQSVQPWCAGFVSWCYKIAAGEKAIMPFEYGLGARGLFYQFETQDAVRLHMDDYEPVAGDLAVWSRCYEDRTNAGHIAIVHSYNDGVLRTIDGNKGSFPAYVKGLEHRDEKWVPGFLGFCDIRAMMENGSFTA